MRRDVLETQFRQKYLLHSTIETLVRAIAHPVLFRPYNNVAADLVLVVQAPDLAGLSELTTGNRRSILPKLLALGAFAVGSTFQAGQSRPEITLKVIPKNARKDLQDPACVCRLDDVGVTRLQDARALGERPWVGLSCCDQARPVTLGCTELLVCSEISVSF
eukprot:SAG22_NODE_505_length_9680_cov_10.482831_3_plen_162_part_00